jgi:hypothetical protein
LDCAGTSYPAVNRGFSKNYPAVLVKITGGFNKGVWFQQRQAALTLTKNAGGFNKGGRFF